MSKNQDNKKADGFIKKAMSKFSKRDYDAAFADFDRAIEFDPSNARAYSVRGYAKSLRGDYTGAINDLDEAIGSGSNNPHDYITRGNSKAADMLSRASPAGALSGATSQQYPSCSMASKGIEAIIAFAKDGAKPKASDGLDFFNTGVT